jgi:uncharacterized surface protein with fasciclin (FAS1) repeats
LAWEPPDRFYDRFGRFDPFDRIARFPNIPKEFLPMNLSKGLALIALTGLVAARAPAAMPQDHCGTKVAAAAGSPSAPEDKDIVDVAVASGKFNTLVAAVKAAGLADALKGPGPFTVFAPTDAAFARLPKGTVEDLLKPENKAKLVSILTYHVASGRLAAADVGKGTGVLTLQGQRLSFRTSGDAVMIDDANVVMADVAAKNGVIHAIDRVVLPTEKNCVEVAAAAGTFSTLLTAAKAAGLAETLSTGGPFTIFAPTDEAFARLPKGAIDELLEPESKAKLAAILKLHVVSGRVDSTGAAAARQAKSLQGGVLRIEPRDGGLAVNGSKVIRADVNASNGIIHAIDAVILPE